MVTIGQAKSGREGIPMSAELIAARADADALPRARVYFNRTTDSFWLQYGNGRVPLPSDLNADIQEMLATAPPENDPPPRSYEGYVGVLLNPEKARAYAVSHPPIKAKGKKG